MILPWQQAQWQQLSDMRRAKRLPHALMLRGMPGLGKRTLANLFLQSLHCAAVDNNMQPCGACRPCHQFLALSHLDHRHLVVADERKIITVDQVRELKHWLTHVSHYGAYKTVVIDAVADLNMAASNALLKFLEEPPGQVCFVLLDDDRRAVLPTIQSRVQIIHCNRPDADQVRDYFVSECDDAAAYLACYEWHEVGPLALRQMDAAVLLQQRSALCDVLLRLRSGRLDAVLIAEKMLKHDIPLLFSLWHGLLLDIIRLHHGAAPAVLLHSDIVATLEPLLASTKVLALTMFAEKLMQCMREWNSPHNIDKHLLLADVLLAWQRA